MWDGLHLCWALLSVPPPFFGKKIIFRKLLRSADVQFLSCTSSHSKPVHLDLKEEEFPECVQTVIFFFHWQILHVNGTYVGKANLNGWAGKPLFLGGECPIQKMLDSRGRVVAPVSEPSTVAPQVLNAVIMSASLARLHSLGRWLLWPVTDFTKLAYYPNFMHWSGKRSCLYCQLL